MVVTCNDPEHRKPAKSLTGAEKEELIERLGGKAALKKSFADFREVTNRARRDQKGLAAQYPNKWAIVGKDGLIAVLNTRSEAGEHARSEGLETAQFIIEYLDPDPPALIL
jgi:hypothetical protein